MEPTLIVAGLLATAAGLVVAGAFALHAGAAHLRDLLAAGRRGAGPMRAVAASRLPDADHAGPVTSALIARYRTPATIPAATRPCRDRSGS